MQKIEENQENERAPIKKALILFLLINGSVVLLYLLGEKGVAFGMLGLQIVFILFWLLPVFLYQVLISKKTVSTAMVISLHSYRKVFQNVSW